MSSYSGSKPSMVSKRSTLDLAERIEISKEKSSSLFFPAEASAALAETRCERKVNWGMQHPWQREAWKGKGGKGAPRGQALSGTKERRREVERRRTNEVRASCAKKDKISQTHFCGHAFQGIWLQSPVSLTQILARTKT